jgi:hypothetical protein
MLLDEYLLAGHLQEPNLLNVLRVMKEQDAIERAETFEDAIFYSFYGQ